jgi:5-methylcytosine-specific restriction endonuclease McrA
MEYIIAGVVCILVVLACIFVVSVIIGAIAGHGGGQHAWQNGQAKRGNAKSLSFEEEWAERERKWLEEDLKKLPYHEYYIDRPWGTRIGSEEYDEVEKQREKRISEIMSEPVSNRVERVERRRKAYAVRGIWPPDMKKLEAEAYQEEKAEQQAHERRALKELRARERNSRHIPNDVKAEAMRRAGGRCVLCGAEKDLAFDHITPWAHGGSSKDAENIQVLCGACNRRKSDRLV